MRDIVGFNPRSAVGAHTGAAMSGARAADSTGFTRHVMQWADLPAQSRAYDDGLGEMLAQGVEQMPDHARKINGRPHQVCLAWRAYPDRIIVVRAVRALTERPDGRMAPNGPWLHNEGTVYGVSAAKRTTGIVPSDVRQDSATPPESAASSLPAEQRRGATAQLYLPLPVQATITRAVPTPDVWLGAFTQWSDGKVVTEQHLRILRIGEGKAVLAAAERAAHSRVEVGEDADGYFNALPWRIKQVTFTLHPDTALNPSAPRTQIGSTR